MTETNKNENILGILRNLERGNSTIKPGHRVAKLNPEGVEVVLPLSNKQILKRAKQLRKLTDGYYSDLSGHLVLVADHKRIDLSEKLDQRTCEVIVNKFIK